jgi:hypothetical protein
MQPDNIYHVDKNSFGFLFDENIYVVPEEQLESALPEPKLETKSNLPVSEEKVIEKKSITEKKTPSIPKIEIKPSGTLKDFAVIVSSGEELNRYKDLLGKILGAIKLDITKVDVYNSTALGEDALSKSDHKYFISFGINPSAYQQVFNQVTKKGNSSFLFSNSLSDLDKDIEMKKALWRALKSLI